MLTAEQVLASQKASIETLFGLTGKAFASFLAGMVKTFTVNHQQWLPGMAEPVVFAAIELPEKSYQIRVNANGSAEPAIAYASPPTGFLLSRE